MEPERWARVKDVFHAVLECEPERRESLLQTSCAGDEWLLEAVRSMLTRQPEAAGFLETPALQLEAMAMARDQDDAGGGAASPDNRVPGCRPHSPRPPWWMFVLATIFLADCLLRGWCWVAGPEGFGFTSRLEGGRYVVAAVTTGGPAERAGIDVGDVIVTRDGRPYGHVSNPRVTRANLEIGRKYRFDLERDGRALAVTIAVPRRQVGDSPGWEANSLWQVAALMMLATACLIAFKRPGDLVARMGALTLAALSVSLYLFNLPPGYAVAWRSVPWGLGALLLIPKLAISLVGPIGLTFFALFPRRLFGARWPWFALWLPALCLVPFYLQPTWLIVYRPDEAYARVVPTWIRQLQTGSFGLYSLGMLAAVTANYLRLTEVHERRRLRVLVVGGAVGTLPGLARIVVNGVAPRSALRDYLMSGWPDVLIAAVFLLFPASFAYAVLRHRVLGVRVIVRQGVQYALARGTMTTLVPALSLVAIGDMLVHGDQPLLAVVEARGWIYAILGGLSVVVHTQRNRWAHALDRRFFREHYDAGRLLRDVVEHARHAGTLEGVGPAVVARIEEALHPEFVSLMFRTSGEPRFRHLASAPAGHARPAIDEDSRVVALLRGAERPLQVTDGLERRLPPWEIHELRDARVGLLVPITMRPSQHEALLALGLKRSEEPYTREDQDELVAIAASLALLVEGPTPAPDASTGAFEECPRCGTCFDSGVSLCPSEQVQLSPVTMPRSLAGRYRLERRLGRGGMGKVYEAIDQALERRVAVKVIRDEWVYSAAAVERFRREARAVAGFDHPNVVTVHDYGVEAGRRAFLVMELLDGVTLRDELRRCERLGAAPTIQLFRGLCSAVEAAHRRQLVHRDLKPENIFLVRAHDGHAVTVKVLDFGVVKPLTASADQVPEGPDTDLGVMVGTVGYMSPEQLMGEPPGVSWDLWALAVVAYESLAGALPFPVASRESWRQLVLSGRHAPLCEHLVDPPCAWEDFFARALATDRTRRPRSAADFFQQLEQALA